MKKSLVFALAFLLFLLSPLGIAKASSGASEVSVEELVKNSQAFNGRFVTLQGFLVVEQLFAKPTVHYLRDNMDNMVRLRFSNAVNLVNYAGWRLEVDGVFTEGNKEMQLWVNELTPLEEGNAQSLGVTGAQNTIVVMADFSNRENTISEGGVYRMIFNDMNGYYMEVSYDLLYVTGAWSGWYKVDNTVRYYGYDHDSWYFIRDAVAKADPYVNFAPYTRFVFVNAGPNEESSGNVYDIWSVRWSGLSIATGDGVTITHGAIVPDIEAGTAGALGVTAHEYGHELGLPDLYGYTGGVGNWDLMAEGTWNNGGHTPAQPTSYCRMLQGWIAGSKVRTISPGTAELVTLDPLEDATGTIQVIKMYAGSDYYLIEARRKVGFDAYLPSERVLVLYYDYIDATHWKLYLRATLAVGQSYRVGNVEVMVTKEDLENWSFQVYVSYKSWSSDQRLTVNTATSYTNYPRGDTVASVGSYVYAVWQDYRDRNWEIYFKRSINNGFSWGADARLTINSAESRYPSIAAYGGYVYVVWQDFRDGNWEIYMRRSENYGATWPTTTEYYKRLTVNAANSTNPAVVAYGRNVHVVWQDNRDGNWEIYYKRSTDNGLTWVADARLTTDGAISEYSSVAAFRDNVYVSWEDSRNVKFDIYVKRSTNNGATWGADTRLTTDTEHQRFPSIAAYGYDVHVVWTDYRYTPNTEIYYRRSNDSGATYKTETRLTSTTEMSMSASVAVKGKTVYVVWQDYRTGRWEVFFKDSPDRGWHWTADRILSAQPNESHMPSISVAGDNVYVVWSDNRDANWEIYFKYRW